MVQVFGADDARRLSLPGRSSREVVSSTQGASRSVSFRIVEIKPLQDGMAERGPHVHEDFEECMYVLAGRGTTRTEAGSHAVKPGDTILVPPGELHATRAEGDAPLTLLCFFPVADIASGTKEYPSWDEARKSR